MDFQDYENLLKHVYRTAPIGLCLFDTELRYQHVNEWLASINGLSVEAHLGKTIGEVIPEVSEGVELILRRVMETGEPVLNGVVEAETLASQEQIRIFLHSYHAVESDEGVVVGVSCIVQDITDRKRAEEELGVSRQMLRDVLNTIPVRVFWKDLDSVYLGCNQLFAKDAGRSTPNEIIGDNDHNMGWAEQAELYRSDDIDVVESGQPKINYEEFQTTPDGKLIWLRSSKIPLRNGNGEVYGVLGTYEDITDRKRAEYALVEANDRLEERVRSRTEKLTQSESSQRHLLESTRAVPWEADAATFQFTYVGPQADGLLGYPHMLWLDNDFWPSHIHPEDREFATAYCLRTMNSKANFDFEYRMLAADGSTVWIHDIVNVESEAGEPKRLRGFMIDISERKKTEELLKDSEARFRMIYEHAPVMIDAYDENGRCVMFNKECEKVFGWTAEEVFAFDNPLMAFYPDPEIRRQVLGTVTTKPEKAFQEWKQTGKSGSETSCLWANFRLPDGLVINLGYDITERKRAEEAMRESATRLQLATDATHIGLWDHDLQTNEVYFSPEWKRQLGYEDHELPSEFGTWESRLHPDDRVYTTKAYESYIDGCQEKYEIEFRLRHKDGSFRWIYTRGEKHCDGTGKPCRVFGCHVDITQRKRAEQQLKDSEARFRMIYEHAPVMIDAFDDSGRCVMFNKECERVLGWTADEVFTHDNPLQMFYPDPEIQRKVIESVTSKPEKMFREWKPKRKDGSETLSLWANFRLPDGQVINLGHDITQRRLAEEKFMKLLEAAPDAMVIVNDQGEILLINRRAEELFGYELRELLGQPIERLIPGHMRDHHARLRTDYLCDPYPLPMDGRPDLVGLHKDGHEFPVEVGLSPCETVDGMTMISSIRDISERKRADTLLREHRNALQILARKLLSAQEDERRRLARELHDDLSQRLAAIGIDSMSLERNVRAVSESCGDQVAALNGRIRKIAADIHQLSRQLHPSILDELGLVKAMKGECDAFTRRTGISISFTAPGEHSDVEKSTELALYRIMQECLQNIAKHSRAVSASVELAVDDENISLNVRDTGIGFDLSEEGLELGVGMASIRERAELLLGSVTIESATGQGTTMNITIPRQGATS